MKTKKYSISMKIVLIAGLIFLASGMAFSQTIEQRKGGTYTYSVTAGAGTDQFRWTIEAPVAPTSVSEPVTGSGTTGDPYVIDWTPDLYEITVTWDAGTSDTISTAGIVTVQKRIPAAAICDSPEQQMDIAFWSTPAAVIDPGETDLDICSTDPITGAITLNLAGAPDDGQSGTGGFEVIYNVTVTDSDLTVDGTNGSIGNGQVVTSDNGTVTIPLPDALTNATAAMQTYTITLVSVEDDFGDGPHAITGETYSINVYPTPSTGIIQSTGTLNRR